MSYLRRLNAFASRKTPSALLPYARRFKRRMMQIKGRIARRKRPTVVLMLHIGRCGSTALGSALGQNPNIYWDGKIHRKAKSLYGDRFTLLDHKKWTKRQILLSGRCIYGFEFKFLPDQYPQMLGLPLSSFLDMCKEIGVTHYIILRRHNTLEQVVSHYSSMARGAWHISKLDNFIDDGRLVLNIDSISTGISSGQPLINYLEEVEQAYREIKYALENQQTLEISYEEDISDASINSTNERVCNFLGIPSTLVEISSRKINMRKLNEIVINFGDVERLLEDTKYRWMLEQDRNRSPRK